MMPTTLRVTVAYRALLSMSRMVRAPSLPRTGLAQTSVATLGTLELTAALRPHAAHQRVSLRIFWLTRAETTRLLVRHAFLRVLLEVTRASRQPRERAWGSGPTPLYGQGNQ